MATKLPANRVEVYPVRHRTKEGTVLMFRFRVVKRGKVGESSRNKYVREWTAKRCATRAHPGVPVVVVPK